VQIFNRRITDVSANIASPGQSGAQVVDPQDNTPYFTLIGGRGETSESGMAKYFRIGGFPVGEWLGNNSNANYAVYVPNTKNANYMILHDRSSQRLYKLYSDGRTDEIDPPQNTKQDKWQY
jgi:hypothetical protein